MLSAPPRAGFAMTEPATIELPPDWHVEARGIGKSFGGNQALIDVDVRIRRGTIHGLIGENGAGKSTLGRVIAGALAPDEGELQVNGRPVHLPHAAGRAARGHHRDRAGARARART